MAKNPIVNFRTTEYFTRDSNPATVPEEWLALVFLIEVHAFRPAELAHLEAGHLKAVLVDHVDNVAHFPNRVRLNQRQGP